MADPKKGSYDDYRDSILRREDEQRERDAQQKGK